MSLVSITGQQRYDIALNVQLVETLTQDFIETLGPIEADKAAPITTAIAALVDALQVAGLASDALATNQAVVTSAGSVTATVTTVGARTAGQADSKAVTFTVVGGVITAISVAA